MKQSRPARPAQHRARRADERKDASMDYKKGIIALLDMIDDHLLMKTIYEIVHTAVMMRDKLVH